MSQSVDQSAVFAPCRFISFTSLHTLIGQKVTVHARHYFQILPQKAKAIIKMATGGNVPELGGYDYQFIRKVPEDWECPVCNLTLKEPVQIMGCGHRLCNICMESLFR